jgi:hypothetical protein
VYGTAQERNRIKSAQQFCTTRVSKPDHGHIGRNKKQKTLIKKKFEILLYTFENCAALIVITFGSDI